MSNQTASGSADIASGTANASSTPPLEPAPKPTQKELEAKEREQGGAAIGDLRNKTNRQNNMLNDPENADPD